MKYERLTERRGNLVIDKCGNCENVRNPQGCTEHRCYEVMKNRLAELEDKIENGTLIELPCKVGDTLWYVNKHRPIPRIEENKVHTIDMFEDLITNKFVVRIWTQNGTFYADNMSNVFKTKAEAEAKLKKGLENESIIISK